MIKRLSAVFLIGMCVCMLAEAYAVLINTKKGATLEGKISRIEEGIIFIKEKNTKSG